MKKTRFILLQVAAYSFCWGIADFVMPFQINSLPGPHLKFLKISNESISPGGIRN